MDDGKRTVLVAALSVYAELLAKNTAQLELEQGKGKGKASDDDVDLKAEIQNQIKLCSELSNQITDATSGKDIVRTFEVACPEPWGKEEKSPQKRTKEEKYENENGWENDISFRGFYAPTAAPSQPRQPAPRTTAKPQQSYIVDNEPYINPFTGFPVIPETGFEAGPSNSVPPPVRTAPTPPTVPSRPLSRRPASTSGPPVRPPPKPQHLRARSVIPSQLEPVPDLSSVLPPQRPAPAPPPSSDSTLFRPASSPPPRAPPPPPPFLAQGPQEFHAAFPTSLPSQYGIAHTSNGLEGRGPTTEEFWGASSPTNIPPPIPSPTPTPTPTLTPYLAPYDWEADIRDVREDATPQDNSTTKLSQRNKYFRYITVLASKALKATGSIRSTARTPSVDEPISPRTREMDNVDEQLTAELPAAFPAELPAELPSYVAANQPAVDSLRRASQESSPPAYDALSDIGRRSSLASNSSTSVAGSRLWSLSSAFSSRTSLSPTSPSTSSSPGTLEDTMRTSRRPSYASFKPQLRKSSSRLSTPATATELHRSMSVSALSNITPAANQRASLSAMHSKPTNTPFSFAGRATPVAEIEEDHLDRRRSASAAPSQRPKSVAITNSQLTVDAMLARDLSFDGSNYTAWKKPSRPFPKLPGITQGRPQRTGYARKLPSTPLKQPSPPGSNNPWRNHMEADQALARALQLQEEQELQMERDMLLAFKMAKGTADDEDLELGNFMHQETAKLIESTRVPVPLAESGSGMWGMDPETLRAQIDWLEALQLEKELNSRIKVDEASFAEAKRLQEQFDQEAKNEEAWEAWKGNNVGQCTSCMEDHAHEELVKVCEHGYCNECLQNAFKAALQSRAPFKCCKKALPIQECLGLEDAFVMEYEELLLELSTPNPMFCSSVQCGKFLPPRVIVGDVATCEKCSTQTCRHCRKQTHPGTFCAEDKETEAVKKLAKKRGWKTCPGCNHLIERSQGCLHMICSRCQTAFCYRCSKPWKDCESTCPDPISATHPKA